MIITWLFTRLVNYGNLNLNVNLVHMETLDQVKNGFDASKSKHPVIQQTASLFLSCENFNMQFTIINTHIKQDFTFFKHYLIEALEWKVNKQINSLWTQSKKWQRDSVFYKLQLFLCTEEQALRMSKCSNHNWNSETSSVSGSTMYNSQLQAHWLFKI